MPTRTRFRKTDRLYVHRLVHVAVRHALAHVAACPRTASDAEDLRTEFAPDDLRLALTAVASELRRYHIIRPPSADERPN